MRNPYSTRPYQYVLELLAVYLMRIDLRGMKSVGRMYLTAGLMKPIS